MKQLELDTYDEVDKTYRDMKNNSSREYDSICPTVERVGDCSIDDVPSTPAEEYYKEVMEELNYWSAIWSIQEVIKKHGWEKVK